LGRHKPAKEGQKLLRKQIAHLSKSGTFAESHSLKKQKKERQMRLLISFPMWANDPAKKSSELAKPDFSVGA
jgi:hypothetical protein